MLSIAVAPLVLGIEKLVVCLIAVTKKVLSTR